MIIDIIVILNCILYFYSINNGGPCSNTESIRDLYDLYIYAYKLINIR